MQPPGDQAHVVDRPIVEWPVEGPPTGELPALDLPRAVKQPPVVWPEPEAQPLTTLPAAPPTIPEKSWRQGVWRLIRMSALGSLAALLVAFLISNSLDHWEQGNRQLANQAADQQAQLAAEQEQVDALQAEVQILKQR